MRDLAAAALALAAALVILALTAPERAERAGIELAKLSCSDALVVVWTDKQVYLETSHGTQVLVYNPIYSDDHVKVFCVPKGLYSLRGVSRCPICPLRVEGPYRELRVEGPSPPCDW